MTKATSSRRRRLTRLSVVKNTLDDVKNIEKIKSRLPAAKATSLCTCQRDYWGGHVV